MENQIPDFISELLDDPLPEFVPNLQPNQAPLTKDLMIQTTKCQSHEDDAGSQVSTGRFNGGTASDTPTGSYATSSCSHSSTETWVKEEKLEMEAKLETLGEKCSKLEVETALLKLKVEWLESHKKRFKEENEYLEQQNQKLENDVEKMRSNAEKMRSDAKKMRSDLHQSQLNCAKTDALMQIQSRNEEMIRLDLQYEIERLKRENAQFKQRLESS